MSKQYEYVRVHVQCDTCGINTNLSLICFANSSEQYICGECLDKLDNKISNEEK